MLPKLIELSDIRGDLHMHTTETDGRATLEEMAEAARARGYQYIAITDHSKALAMANGLDEKRAVAFANQVRDMKDLGIRVFSGLECDIRRDGAMDLENDALAELDFVIGSVHSYMNLESAEMTDRLHARARIPVTSACWDIPPAAFCCIAIRFRSISTASPPKPRDATCISKSTRSPERLDLGPRHGPHRQSHRLQSSSINTDAHHPKHLANMPYGVLMARRGWLEAGATS